MNSPAIARFWLAQGKTSPEIRIIVGAAANTVKQHVEKVMQKLGVEPRLAAALKATDIRVRFPKTAHE